MCGITLLLERGAEPRSLLGDERLALDIETRLRQRGPDHWGALDRAAGAGWRLRLCSAVLHLRGDALTPQPLEDARGNALCWNGEVFGYQDNIEGHVAQLEHGNDTQWLSDLLAQRSDPIAGDDGDGSAMTRRVVDTLRGVRGPFALVWFHAASQRLFFGHDRFGRRSLLVHSDAVDLLTSLADDAPTSRGSVAVDAAALKRLVLSSVALSHGCEDAPAMDFAEVPANGLFVLDLERERLEFYAYDPLPAPTARLANDGATSIGVVSDHYDCGLPQSLPADSAVSALDRAAHGLLLALSNAVGVRVRTVPRHPLGPGHARVGVLFSGGLDSVVLAALTHFHVVDHDEPIDLLNVCFDKASQFQSPDRLAARISYQELCELFPTRRWRFMCVNEDYDEAVLGHQDELLALLRPCDTHMDLNIGAAFWCLSRCRGTLLPHTAQLQGAEHVDLNAFLTQRGVPRAQRDAEDALEALRLFEADDDHDATGFCPATKCRRKLKPGCPLGVCRLCCLKVQKALSKLQCAAPDSVEQRTGRLHLASMLPRAAEAAEDRIDALLGVWACHPEAMVCRVHRTRQDKASDVAGETTDPLTAEHAPSPSSEPAVYTTSARVLLVGIGADEQLGGYGRHKTAFVEGGAEALDRELARDMARIWKRNLGRDDRCISAHGREARFPFLDERVVELVATLPLETVCDFAQPRGRGDKLVLRVAAAKLLGLANCAQLAKRAIQFGSRIAKHANVAAFGSNRQASGDAKIVSATRGPRERGDDE